MGKRHVVHRGVDRNMVFSLRHQRSTVIVCRGGPPDRYSLLACLVGNRGVFHGARLDICYRLLGGFSDALG